MKLLAVALALAYPVLMHAAVLYDLPVLRTIALCGLIALIVVAPRPRRVGAWLLLAGLLAGVVALSRWEGARYAAYLPPIVMHVLLLWVFGRTLLPGREALVAAIGRGVHGSLTPQMASYSRGVTIMWTGCFAVLLLLSIVLPFVSAYAWSLCTNVLNYVFIASVLTLEFSFRRWRFPTHHHPGFFGYLRIVATSNVRGF